MPNTSILTLIFNDGESLPKTARRMKNSSTNDSISSNGSSSATSLASNAQFQQKLMKSLPQSTNLSLSDFLNPILGYSELAITSLTTSSSFSSLSSSSFAHNPNLEAYFTHTLGSSFYNGSAPYALVLSNAEIKDVCQLIKKLFVKSVINQMARYLNDFLTQQQVGGSNDWTGLKPVFNHRYMSRTKFFKSNNKMSCSRVT